MSGQQKCPLNITLLELRLDFSFPKLKVPPAVAIHIYISPF